MTSFVRLEINDGVGEITLDNPPLNLFTHALTAELDAVLLSVESDESIRTVVIAGAGARALSAGSDINEFPPLMESGRVVEDKLALENAAFDCFARLPQPTIAVLQGVTLGGGAEFALCADYRIMEDNARIGFPEIKLGTIPGSGGLARLPRLINPSIALQLFLDGESIDAERSLAIGLVNEVVAAGRSLDAARARAHIWASRPVLASRAIKRAVYEPTRDLVSAEMIASLAASRVIFATEDMREGVAAFKAKRQPNFKHR
jgi:enoyl-CoA hydratase/carnithine racemase